MEKLIFKFGGLWRGEVVLFRDVSLFALVSVLTLTTILDIAVARVYKKSFFLSLHCYSLSVPDS